MRFRLVLLVLACLGSGRVFGDPGVWSQAYYPAVPGGEITSLFAQESRWSDGVFVTGKLEGSDGVVRVFWMELAGGGAVRDSGMVEDVDRVRAVAGADGPVLLSYDEVADETSLVAYGWRGVAGVETRTLRGNWRTSSKLKFHPGGLVMVDELEGGKIGVIRRALFGGEDWGVEIGFDEGGVEVAASNPRFQLLDGGDILVTMDIGGEVDGMTGTGLVRLTGGEGMVVARNVWSVPVEVAPLVGRGGLALGDRRVATGSTGLDFSNQFRLVEVAEDGGEVVSRVFTGANANEVSVADGGQVIVVGDLPSGGEGTGLTLVRFTRAEAAKKGGGEKAETELEAVRCDFQGGDLRRAGISRAALLTAQRLVMSGAMVDGINTRNFNVWWSLTALASGCSAGWNDTESVNAVGGMLAASGRPLVALRRVREQFGAFDRCRLDALDSRGYVCGAGDPEAIGVALSPLALAVVVEAVLRRNTVVAAIALLNPGSVFTSVVESRDAGDPAVGLGWERRLECGGEGVRDLAAEVRRDGAGPPVAVRVGVGAGEGEATVLVEQSKDLVRWSLAGVIEAPAEGTSEEVGLSEGRASYLRARVLAVDE